MKPTVKSNDIKEFIDRHAEAWFGRTKTDSIEGGICVCCGKEALRFRDPLSKKEYTISGLCQDCQDSIFGVDDEDHY